MAAHPGNGAEGPFVLAVPSKGRLQEAAAAFFARAGLELVQGRGARDYRGAITGLPGVEVAYVSSAEIVGQLAAGAAHFGVAGEDLVREKVADVEARLELLSPLGFGHANVVVAAPKAWIDVRTMADLDDVASAYRAKRGERMRVATKYVNLTRRYFAEHGIADYRIVESLGATEGAPASGAAELIVDITTTGATLEANALKTLDDGTILRSQATLIASLTAPWGANARQAARDILARIAASEEALKSREVRARLPRPAHGVVETAAERFGAVSATGEDVDPHGFVALHCARDKVAELSGWLLTQGAERVSVAALEQTFAARRTIRELAVEQRVALIQSELAQEQLKTIDAELANGPGSPTAQPVSPTTAQKAHIEERERYEDLLDTNFSLMKVELNLLRMTGQINDWVTSSLK